MSAPILAPSARRPSGSKWKHVGTQIGLGHRHALMWERRGVRVLSELAIAALPGGGGKVGAQWLISVSDNGIARPRVEQVARALRDFDMVGAEEDNHHPGIARHFWMPVDPAYRVDCECKADELPVVEADGYRWSNDPKECRGCELERLVPQRRCPLHTSRATP